MNARPFRKTLVTCATLCNFQSPAFTGLAAVPILIACFFVCRFPDRMAIAISLAVLACAAIVVIFLAIDLSEFPVPPD
jgi:hypothetical protein